MTQEARDYVNHYHDCWVLVPKLGGVRRVWGVGDSTGQPWEDLRNVPSGEDSLHFLLRPRTPAEGILAVPISEVVKDIPDELGVRYTERYGPMLISRTSARQWRKGVCSRTLQVVALRGAMQHHLNPDHDIATSLFCPDYTPAANIIAGADGAISSNFYTTTINGVRMLCYRRWPVGYVRDGALHLDKQVAHLADMLRKDTDNSVEVLLV